MGLLRSPSRHRIHDLRGKFSNPAEWNNPIKSGFLTRMKGCLGICEPLEAKIRIVYVCAYVDFFLGKVYVALSESQ